jgi:hypothetical protein
VLLAAQWPFGDFLMSPLSRNWVFATDQFGYYIDSDWSTFRHVFYDWDGSRAALAAGLLAAIPLGVMSARIALWWGDWMRRVKR